MTQTNETDTMSDSFFSTPAPASVNTTLLRKAATHTIKTADEHDYNIQRLIFFGSHATGDATEESDIDILLVADGWNDTQYTQRAFQFAINWDYDETPPSPDYKCLTPAEFEEVSEAGDNPMVNDALDHGIEVELED